MGVGILLEVLRTLDERFRGQLGHLIPSDSVFSLTLSMLLIGFGLAVVLNSQVRPRSVLPSGKPIPTAE